MQITGQLPRETGRDYALRILRENIISMELQPGSTVSENELASALGLSRTPVREALIELAAAKAVNIAPQKRSTISYIDYDLIEESSFLRNALECAVVVLVCDVRTDDDITWLDNNIKLQKFYIDNHSPSMMLEVDNDFHRKLFAIAQKQNLYTLIHNHGIHLDRVRNLAMDSVEELTIVQEHSLVLDAIRLRDKAKARDSMEQHLQRYLVDRLTIEKKYPQYIRKNSRT